MQPRKPHDDKAEPGVNVTDKGNVLGGKQSAQHPAPPVLASASNPLITIADKVASSVMIIQPPTGLCPRYEAA